MASPSPWGTLRSVFVVGVSLNYLWELAQAPLYAGLVAYTAAVFWHCFTASLGDGIMVLLIFLVGRILLHEWSWFERPGIPGYSIMFGTGLSLAVVVELVAVYLLERWQYTGAMPTLPGLRIGLVPIAQMLLLPPLIFRIVAVFNSKTKA